jgi:hypothetical protein
MDKGNKRGQGIRKDSLDPTLSAGDLILCRGAYATVTGIKHHAPGEHAESPIRNDWTATEIVTVRGSRWHGRETRYTIEISRRVVSYRAEECRFKDEEGHNSRGSGAACTGECTWLDGDSRDLETSTTETVTPNMGDVQLFGSAVGWATDYIWRKTDASEPSGSPIGETLPEHSWLSGTFQDPFEGDSRVTETTVRLTGDWTPEQRAAVFRSVTGSK